MNKKIGLILLITGILFALSRGVYHTYVSYEYKGKIGSKWLLSDRASTIAQKSKYLDEFVAGLEKCSLDGVHDAIFYPNESNGFTENMIALKSLQKRLHDISGMDENSFAYQAAMQQITKQEQGEAGPMLSVFSGCWEKQNHYTTWNIFFVVSFLIIQILLVLIGFSILTD